MGLLLDCKEGTLEYFIDGRPLGVAFTGLHSLSPLYPAASLDDLGQSLRLLQHPYIPHCSPQQLILD